MRCKSFQSVSAMLVLAIFALAAGCKDSVVVRSEKTVYLSYRAVNAFVEYDNANAAILKQKVPAVHQAAERIRVESPPVFLAAWDAIAAYKVTRTPEAQNKMLTDTSSAAALGDRAGNQLAAAKAAGGQ